MVSAWIGPVVAFGGTAVTVPLVLAASRRYRIVDVPNERSSHAHTTARGGGTACAAGLLAGLAFAPRLSSQNTRLLLFAVVAFGLVGLVDDLRGVPQLPRLGIHFGLSAVSLWWLLADLAGPLMWQLVFGLGCLVWVVGYLNAFNLMDGINGLSVAQTVVAGVAWAVIGAIENVPALEVGGLLATGAALGFAPYNFPSAQIFLGDVGSHVLGAWLAVLVVIGLRAGVAPEAMLAPVAVYLADTTTTLARRVRAGETWYLPHRTHTYQRLTDFGWSHAKTTGFVALVMVVCAALGAVGLASLVEGRIAAGTLLLGVLLGYLWSPRLAARRR